MAIQQIAPIKLAGRFTAQMLTVTSQPIDNMAPETPDIYGRNAVASKLTKLAESILVPIEALEERMFGGKSRPYGIKLLISSAYRNRAVNRAVGGDPASAHLEGRAADLVDETRDVWVFFGILAFHRAELPYDKLIFERRFGRGGDRTELVHVQIPRSNIAPRRRIFISPSPAEYIEIQPDDPRLAVDHSPWR